MSDLNKIKSKIKSIDSTRWWGDDFDVRFYVISKIKQLENKFILDLGGGIGIISSELKENNFRINLDYSVIDLKTCNQNFDSIHNTCASMTNLPFKSNSFDFVICCNLLEVAKNIDIHNNQMKKDYEKTGFPTIILTLREILRILKNDGVLYLTTPNNAYYKTSKLTFHELENCFNEVFKEFKIYFYNTHIRFGKNRKLDLANIIPKISSRFVNQDKIILDLIKEKNNKKYSVSFFVEAKKTQLL